MERLLAAGLFLILGFGVMTAWVADLWAVFLLYALVFVLGAIWAATALARPRLVRFNFASTLVWMAAAWGAVQLVCGATVNRWATMNAALLWTANALLFFLSLQLFSKAERREAFLRWLLYGGVALAVEALFQLYTANGKVFWAVDIKNSSPIVMGPVPYHNHFAAIILLILPIGVYFALLDSKNLISHGWMVGLLAGAVFASQSRSGSVLVVLELIVLLAMGVRSSPARTTLARAVAILLLVAAGGAVAGWEGLWARLHQGDDTRVAVSATSLEMTRHGPITGHGLGTWPTVYPMFAHFDDGLFMNQGHDDWLQWAAEGGIGFVFVLACFAGMISGPGFGMRWGMGIPAVLLLCLVDFPLQKPAVSLLLFALAGAVSASLPPGSDWHFPTR